LITSVGRIPRHTGGAAFMVFIYISGLRPDARRAETMPLRLKNSDPLGIVELTLANSCIIAASVMPTVDIHGPLWRT
jgi:hypothetical protein